MKNLQAKYFTGENIPIFGMFKEQRFTLCCFHPVAMCTCRADSVTWNPHKSLGVPLQCSAFLTKHEGLLASCNSTKATYLFQQDKVSYDVSYDTGDKSIQCGRLNDVFKLWLMWKKKVHVCS